LLGCLLGDLADCYDSALVSSYRQQSFAFAFQLILFFKKKGREATLHKRYFQQYFI